MDLAGASREELLAVLAQRDGELAEVRQALVAANERIAELVERVADLAARAGRDSSNSSRPPSSDPPYAPKAKRGMRGTSGRKPGKQPGAPGATRCQVEDPDEVVVCELAACPDCGSSLAGAPVERVCRRQVFDPPPPPVRPHVTEYQIVTRRCGCGRQVVGAGPAGVSAPVGYGPHAAALAVYLGVGHHLPVKRAAAVLARLAGARVSSGWLAAQRARAARLLEAQFLPRVRALLAQVGVLHVDETRAGSPASSATSTWPAPSS